MADYNQFLDMISNELKYAESELKKKNFESLLGRIDKITEYLDKLKIMVRGELGPIISEKDIEKDIISIWGSWWESDRNSNDFITLIREFFKRKNIVADVSVFENENNAFKIFITTSKESYAFLVPRKSIFGNVRQYFGRNDNKDLFSGDIQKLIKPCRLDIFSNKVKELGLVKVEE